MTGLWQIEVLFAETGQKQNQTKGEKKDSSVLRLAFNFL